MLREGSARGGEDARTPAQCCGGDAWPSVPRKGLRTGWSRSPAEQGAPLLFVFPETLWPPRLGCREGGAPNTRTAAFQETKEPSQGEREGFHRDRIPQGRRQAPQHGKAAWLCPGTPTVVVLDTQLHLQPQGLAGLRGAAEAWLSLRHCPPCPLGCPHAFAQTPDWPLSGARASGALRTRSVPSGGRMSPTGAASLLLPDLSPSVGTHFPVRSQGAGSGPGCGGGGWEAEPRGEGAKQPVTALASGSLSLTWAGLFPTAYARSWSPMHSSHQLQNPLTGVLSASMPSASCPLTPPKNVFKQSLCLLLGPRRAFLWLVQTPQGSTEVSSY